MKLEEQVKALLEVKRCVETLAWGQNKIVVKYWEDLRTALKAADEVLNKEV